jgi:arabinose-5-phosphate isomerase
MQEKSILETAVKTLKLEAEALMEMGDRLGDGFTKVIDLLQQMKGRLVVSGIGKSAIIGQKIVATLNSTGTPAIFMHAADAIHGDLGMVQQDDVVMIISKSGESPEIKVLVTLIQNFSNPIVAMVGNINSTLARSAHHILDTTVSQEACPNNLAPTSSTTAQLAMGDALAVCMMEARGFGSEDFAKFHPGGALGKKLYLRVDDLSRMNERPAVGLKDNLKAVILEMTKKRLGLTAVLNEEGKLAGVITDGDLRRMLEKGVDVQHTSAADIMTANPKTISPESLAVDALDRMRKNNITQLIVAEADRYEGVIHLHDLIREGLI